MNAPSSPAAIPASPRKHTCYAPFVGACLTVAVIHAGVFLALREPQMPEASPVAPPVVQQPVAAPPVTPTTEADHFFRKAAAEARALEKQRVGVYVTKCISNLTDAVTDNQPSSTCNVPNNAASAVMQSLTTKGFEVTSTEAVLDRVTIISMKNKVVR